MMQRKHTHFKHIILPIFQFLTVNKNNIWKNILQRAERAIKIKEFYVKNIVNQGLIHLKILVH